MGLIEAKQNFLGQELTLVSDPDLEDPFSRWLRRPGWKAEDHTTLAALLTEEDDLIIDLGANYGTFFLPVCLKTGAKCIAVEALRANVEVLAQAITANNLNARTNVVHAAVMGETGTVHIAGDSAYASIRDEGEEVKAITLDYIDLHHDLTGLSLVKMDIEGCELETLEAADAFFEKHTSVSFIFEANGAHSFKKKHLPQDLLRIFERWGYEIYLVRKGRCVRRSSSDFQEAGLSDYFATKKPLDESVLQGFSFEDFSDDEVFDATVFTLTQMKAGYKESAMQQMHLAPDWLKERLRQASVLSDET
ncbi:MAG: FkbM family methyltransferase [Pseudomonadota bacterium]